MDIRSRAGVRSILSFFRGAVRRRRGTGSGFWDINLHTLGGPIPMTQTEAVNLPNSKSRRPRQEIIQDIVPRLMAGDQPIREMPARKPVARETPAREQPPRESPARDATVRQ